MKINEAKMACLRKWTRCEWMSAKPPFISSRSCRRRHPVRHNSHHWHIIPGVVMGHGHQFIQFYNINSTSEQGWVRFSVRHWAWSKERDWPGLCLYELICSYAKNELQCVSPIINKLDTACFPVLLLLSPIKTTALIIIIIISSFYCIIQLSPANYL